MHRPIHCLQCQEETGVAIPKHCPHILPECKKCGAPIGLPCVTKNGDFRKPHKSRTEKATP